MKNKVMCGFLCAVMGTAMIASAVSAEDVPKYGVVLKVLSEEFWTDMADGIEAKAEELGVEVEIMAANTADDVEGQVSILETMIESGQYDAFMVAPISDANLVNTVADANAQGYLVANADERINADALEAAGGSLVSFVSTDNVIVGRTAGEYIASLLEEGDEVAIVEGKAGAKSGEDRRDGCKAAFEEAGLNIVDSQPADWDKTRAYDLASNLLNKHENLKAIYCCNDVMGMGVYEAVADSGRDVIVVGTDGNTPAIDSIRDGGMAATVAQNPAGVGARTLELLHQAFTNGDTPGSAAIVEESVDPILVTAENCDTYKE